MLSGISSSSLLHIHDDMQTNYITNIEQLTFSRGYSDIMHYSCVTMQCGHNDICEGSEGSSQNNQNMAVIVGFIV